MNKEEIALLVKNEFSKWASEIDLPPESEITLSDQATEFLALLIYNIENDSSDSWIDKKIYSKQSIEKALPLLSVILNSVYRTMKAQYSPMRLAIKFNITTWEILHTLSKNLDRLCFIPKR